MKVIFLDIDGVLNVIGQGYDEYGQLFHPHLVENLKYIIDQTGAKIMISSSWRSCGIVALQEMWAKRNLPGEIIGHTPIGYKYLHNRGEEINHMIDLYLEDMTNYVILDDDDDMLEEQLSHFVQTSNNHDHPDCVDIGYGLTRICAEKAIKILNS